MTPSYARFSGACAVLAGIIGLLYSIAFVILRDNLLSAVFLMAGGLLSSVVFVALYKRLRETDPPFALWALLLGFAAALASASHGGYDLANVINPPTAAVPDLPSAIDPRGLATFGLAGVAVFVVGWLMGRSGDFPKGLGYLGYLLGVFLVVVYLGRLIVLSPASPLVLGPAAVTGFLLNPVWYIWLGLAIWRGSRIKIGERRRTEPRKS